MKSANQETYLEKQIWIILRVDERKYEIIIINIDKNVAHQRENKQKLLFFLIVVERENPSTLAKAAQQHAC